MNALGLFNQKLSSGEKAYLDGLDTPYKIQSFLDCAVYPSGEENRSALEVLRQRKAHCLDGGLFAAAALRRIGFPPLVLDMQPEEGMDDDHVLALYKEFGCWGAVAKSNFSGLRFREPVYRTLRELVLSFFDGFFNVKGEKTLRAYTRPINLARFDNRSWMTDPKGVDAVEVYLKNAKLIPLISPDQAGRLSPVDARSYEAGMLGINPDGAFKP